MGHFTEKEKKMRSKNQFGRSMIEMLGVLAIIGVLSVGGIAGYSKAMMKFKINKTIDQISQAAAATQTLFAQQKDFKGLPYGIMVGDHPLPTAVDSLILSDSVQKGIKVYHGSGGTSSKDYYENEFGGTFSISTSRYYPRKGFSSMTDFYILLTGLPSEACMALGSTDWGATGMSGLIGIAVGRFFSASGDIIYPGCKGDGEFDNSSNYSGYYACADSLPISPAKITEACKRVDESSGDVSIVFSK